MNDKFLELCSEGNLENAQRLIESGSVDPCYQGTNRRNALHLAVERGDEKTALWLLRLGGAGFMIEARDSKGLSPLAVAASTGNTKLCDVLINAGANTHTRDNDRRTILIRAIMTDDVETALWAISKCDVNALDSSGRNALHYACEKGNLQIVRNLINSGCNLNIMDNSGLTPLGYALDRGYRYEIAELLCASGADTDVTRRGRQPIIYTMIERRNSNAVRFLLKHGANTLIRGGRYQNVWSALNWVGMYEFEEPAKAIGKMILETKHPRSHDNNMEIAEEIFESAQDNIFYFEHCDKHVNAVSENGQQELKMTLKSICARLADKGFIMPHSGFVVNLSKVDRIVGYKMIMKNGDILPISQKRSVETRREYKLFSKNGS